MELTTKFNLGQTVYPINCYSEKIIETCAVCNGSKNITLVDDESYRCPKCYGNGNLTSYGANIYHVGEATMIGKVDVEKYFKPNKGDDRIKYMLYSTGIGSGTLWDEKDIFATEEDASAECEKRNILKK